MEGIVRNLQAVVAVPFARAGQPNIAIEFVLDTGFAGELLLPELAVNVLGLPRVAEMTTNLADGSRREMPMHKATILWDGETVEVGVLAAGSHPLLGTALLANHRVEIEFDEDGTVHVY